MTKRIESKDLLEQDTWHYHIYIHLNKGKYLFYGQDPLNDINMSDTSHISQVYSHANKLKQSM